MEIEKGNSKMVPESKGKLKPHPAPKEYKMHECGFINYLPQAITCFAYFPPMNLLAVAREDCTIEYWKTTTWNQISIIHLTRTMSVRKLQFVPNSTTPRLIVTHMNGCISEYGASSSQPHYIFDGSISPVWDSDINLKGEIVLGCDDGGIKVYLLDMELDGPKIRPPKYLMVVRSYQSKCLTVSWGDKVIFAGYDNGVLRKIDAVKNAVTLNINIGGISGTKKQTPSAINSLLNLPPDALAVGCADGSVTIVETKFGTQIKRITFHMGPILALSRHWASGDSFFATGSDSRIISIQRVPSSNRMEDESSSSANVRDWSVTSKERGQSHDIRALVHLDEETIISGGITTDICIYKISNGRFIERNIGIKGSQTANKIRHVAALPMDSCFSVASVTCLILYRRAFSLELWRIQPLTTDYIFLAEIKSENNPILCSDISRDGKHVVYSTDEQTYLLKVNVETLAIQTKLTLTSSSQVAFSHDCVNLYLIQGESATGVVNLCKYNFRSRTKELFKIPSTQFWSTSFALNKKETFALVGSKLSNQLFCFDIEKSEWHQVSTFVGPNVTITSLAYAHDPSTAIIMYENNKFVLYNMKHKILSKWSQAHTHHFPMNLLHKFNRFIGAVALSNSKVMLFSHYYVVLVYIGDKIPKEAPTFKGAKFILTEEEKEDEQTQTANLQVNFSVIHLAKPTLGIARVFKEEFINLGIDWDYIASQFPDPLNTKKFGN